MNINDSVKVTNDLTTKGMDRISSLAELNMRAWEKLAARQMDGFSLCLEQGMRLMKLATEAKSANDYLKGQVEILKDVSERMLVETKSSMKLAGEVRDDYRAWYEQSLSGLSADLRQAVAPAA